MEFDLGLARESRWSFATSNGGGVGIGFVGAEAGSITLRSPAAQVQKFGYGALGIGATWGLKLPSLGKVHLPGASVGSSEAFAGGGLVYMTSYFRGAELSISDIRGACFFLELAGGLVWGGSGVAMVFGLNPALVTMAAASRDPASIVKAVATATGFLLFSGVNFGIQAGASATGFAGLMYPLGGGLL